MPHCGQSSVVQFAVACSRLHAGVSMDYECTQSSIASIALRTAVAQQLKIAATCPANHSHAILPGAIPITSRHPDSALNETCGLYDLGPPARRSVGLQPTRGLARIALLH